MTRFVLAVCMFLNCLLVMLLLSIKARFPFICQARFMLGWRIYVEALQGSFWLLFLEVFPKMD